MPFVFGRERNRGEIMRKVGSLKQVCSIRPIQYTGGDADLVKAFLVSTGGGLTFSVNENKCLDVFDMHYKGINLGFLSKAELHSPYKADNRGEFYTYSQGCGMLYTAGLANVGKGYTDEEDPQYYHGMIKNRACENVCSNGEWQGDEYHITLSGSIKESAFFGRNLTLHRKITTAAGSKSIRIHDTVENEDFKADELMLLYHLNAGFPLLDEGTEFIVPTLSIEALGDYAQEMLDQYTHVSAPIDGADECVYSIKMKNDAAGYTASCLVNRELGLAIYVKYDAKALPYMIEWKSMRSGDYAFGMLPSSCKPIGKPAARKEGGVKILHPGEKWELNLEIGVLEGEKEIEAFIQYIGNMQ